METSAIRSAIPVSLLPALLLVGLAAAPATSTTAATHSPLRHAVEVVADSGSTAAQAQAMVNEQLDALTSARHCWVPAESKPADVIPTEILVRGAHVDSGVVRVVSFDEGWRLAKSGDAYVVGACR
jgi:hypothetical protein